ncbi:MAG: YegP family protein [Microbacteriaceae bacterium]|nr:YegP family protein [Microbacteriaceae bacterium]MCL2793668.1 YegP family protein [Microbacteriaceae bacterium]
MADPYFELKKSSNGKFHFNLHAANGQVIAQSQMYESKASAANGIKSVQTNAAKAEVRDLSAD